MKSPQLFSGTVEGHEFCELCEVKKTEYQPTLKNDDVEYEDILDEEEKLLNDDEPWDLADRVYEEWRDEVRSRDRAKK